MNKLKIKKGFTLVELIIVITILVILATIAFVSFQNYTKDARDSNRLMSIKNIQNGLEGFQIKTGIYPEPETPINIMVGSSIISKQGYFGESQSDIINIDKLPLDPLDGTKYIYSINANKNKYQLLSYLEANSQLSFVNETYADDLSKRNIKSFGNKLGIVLNENNNNITQSVDIVNSTGVYKVILDNSSSGTFIGTGLILSQINPISSCKKILENGSKKDGIYQINPLGGDGFEVYCDMTTDGGGWTLVFNEKNIGTFWNGSTMSVNFSGSNSCVGYSEYCVNKSYSTSKITSSIMLDGGSDIKGTEYNSRVIFNGVNNILGKTVYDIFNNTGSQSSQTQTFWSINGVKTIKGFNYNMSNSSLLFRDYGYIIYQYKKLALNEKDPSGNGLISADWPNGCKWPNNPCYPNDWYLTYRFWIR